MGSFKRISCAPCFCRFSSALLVFQVHFLARYILPWFGGSPGLDPVYCFSSSACCADTTMPTGSQNIVPIKRQPALHFYPFSMAMLPITPNDELAYGYADPTVGVMTLLLTTVEARGALPLHRYFSTGFPMFAHKIPFSAVRASNAGSRWRWWATLYRESNLSLHWQTWSWSMWLSFVFS